MYICACVCVFIAHFELTYEELEEGNFKMGEHIFFLVNKKLLKKQVVQNKVKKKKEENKQA